MLKAFTAVVFTLLCIQCNYCYGKHSKWVYWKFSFHVKHKLW